MGDPAVGIIAPMVANGVLRQLDLSKCDLGVMAGMALGTALSDRRTEGALVELVLSYNPGLGGEGVAALADGLQREFPSPSRSRRVSSRADPRRQGAPPSEVAVIAPRLTLAAHRNDTLERLVLNRCAVDDIGACALSDALEKNKALKVLSLAQNNVGPETGRSFAHSA